MRHIGMSPKCAAGIAAGIASLTARRMQSMVVLVVRDHQPHAAGGRALTTFPGGATTLSGLKWPSLGLSCGVVRHLKAWRAMATAPAGPVLIEPSVCSAKSEKSTVI